MQNNVCFLFRQNCGAMAFAVSARGRVSVKTLCSFERATMEGDDLVGTSMTVCSALFLLEL